jgi:hypothetical protein
MPFTKHNSISIYYEIHGAGTPFLFFSETACPGDIWNNFQVPEFSRDHLVVTHDYRARGSQAGQRFNTRAKTLSAMLRLFPSEGCGDQCVGHPSTTDSKDNDD